MFSITSLSLSLLTSSAACALVLIPRLMLTHESQVSGTALSFRQARSQRPVARPASPHTRGPHCWPAGSMYDAETRPACSAALLTSKCHTPQHRQPRPHRGATAPYPAGPCPRAGQGATSDRGHRHPDRSILWALAEWLAYATLVLSPGRSAPRGREEQEVRPAS